MTTAGEMLFLIDSRKCATEYIEVTQGDRFVIEMDSPAGRIVEPALGSHTIVEHHCRSEWYPEGCPGPRKVSFDFVAVRAGEEFVEFPLIQEGWEGEDDPTRARRSLTCERL